MNTLQVVVAAFATSLVFLPADGIAAAADPSEKSGESNSANTAARARSRESPEIHEDRRVTFRLRAPNAVQVSLYLLSKTSMQKDEAGVWSHTTDPLEPDVYFYGFDVDGLAVLDPGAPVMTERTMAFNVLHIHGPQALPWDATEVARGTVHRHSYRSSVTGSQREFLVYTPAGYDPRSTANYPVLYLLHGVGGDAGSWVAGGPAAVILDNLIGRGKAVPMIVVMPYGIGVEEMHQPSNWRPEKWRRNAEVFRETFFKEITPQVERSYQIDARPERQAIAGYSMGGVQALFIGLNAPDRFAWIGGFSCGGWLGDFEDSFGRANRNPVPRWRLIWLACGREDTRELPRNRRLHEWLGEREIQHVWNETAGAHTMFVWRRNLAEFVPLLFRER